MNSLQELTLEELDNVLGAGDGRNPNHFTRMSYELMAVLVYLLLLITFYKPQF